MVDRIDAMIDRGHRHAAATLLEGLLQRHAEQPLALFMLGDLRCVAGDVRRATVLRDRLAPLNADLAAELSLRIREAER